MSAVRYPQRIQSVHVESIDGELCIYDTARQRVHALNHTAAFVWQRCDGRTAPAELAAALSAETSIDDAEAVVQLTLQELAAAHLLAGPIDEVARVSRRDLLRRGVAAAAIPAIYSIVAPTPAAAQSVPRRRHRVLRLHRRRRRRSSCPPASSASRLWLPARGAVSGFRLAWARVARVVWAVGRRRPCRDAGRVAHRACRWRRLQMVFLRLRRPVASTEAAEAPADGGGGGGASSVRDGATPLVIAGGGGGGGASDIAVSGNGGAGGDGGGLTAVSGPESREAAVVAEADKSPAATGAFGLPPVTAPTDPPARRIRVETVATNLESLVVAVGVGATAAAAVAAVEIDSTTGAGGGGGGSSFTAPGATGVVHQQGVNSGAGSVTISW